MIRDRAKIQGVPQCAWGEYERTCACGMIRMRLQDDVVASGLSGARVCG